MGKLRTIDFFDELLNDGSLYWFAQLVKGDENLELLFRGNSGDNGKVCIYYKNNIVFKLAVSKVKRNVSITINYDHLRYTEDYRTIISKYNKEFLFPIKEPKRKKNSCGIGYVSKSVGREEAKILFNDDYVKGLYMLIKSAMEDFFNPKKTKDQFRETLAMKQTGRAKPNYLEKVKQQLYFKSKSCLKDGLFVYDLEYKEAFSGTEEKTKEMSSRKISKINKPDALGIRFDMNGIPIKLALIELKSKPSAEKGSSGTVEHLEGMMEAMTKTDFMKDRIKEAKEILDYYKKLELKGLSRGTKIPDLEQFINPLDKPEIIVVYTDDSAINKEIGIQKEKSEKYGEIEYSVELFL